MNLKSNFLFRYGIISLALIGGVLTSCEGLDVPEAEKKILPEGEEMEIVENNQNNIDMGTIVTLHGEEFHTVGKLPLVGEQIKNFTLTDGELNEKTLEDFKGQNLVLNIFPSVNTPVCAQSVRTFNEKAAGLENTKVLCISKDLPFAQAAFCGAEGIENVVNLSDFRSTFGEDYGVTVAEGPFKGLMSRAVIVVDSTGKIVHSQQVTEIADEPNYEAALTSIQ